MPSHGPVGDAGFIEGYRDYLAEVARRTAEAKRAGQDPAQAVETVAAAMADRYPDRARLGGAVRCGWRGRRRGSEGRERPLLLDGGGVGEVVWLRR